MIYSNAYDTIFGIISKNDRTESYLEAISATSMYKGNKIVFSTGLNVYYIGPFDVEVRDIPSFKHPYVFKKGDETIIFSDIRPFINTQKSLKEDILVTSNSTELNFTFMRTILNAEFIENIKEFSINLKFANTIYAAWISDTVTKRFGLNPEEQLKVFVIAYYFYLSLFYKDEINEDTKILAVKNIVDASRSTVNFVRDVSDKITQMNSVVDMITNINTILANRRLADLNVGTLATIISTTWYGTFAKDILAVSLEHAPTFAAIVGVSVTQRYYKKSMIATISDRYGKGGKLEHYITNLNRIILNRIPTEAR